MRLIAFTVQGYRRFHDKTSVKLHGDLVAFVGPNEAGKSSLLEAIAHLSKDPGFAAKERPRRTKLAPELTWHFQLDKEERALLRDLPDASVVERAVLTKKDDDLAPHWEFEPRRPRRDRATRHDTADLLIRLRERAELVAADAGDVYEFLLEDYDNVIGTLRADVENYTQENLDGLRTVAVRLREVEVPDDGAGDEEATDEQLAVRDEWVMTRDRAAAAIVGVAETEARPSPWRQCVDALTPRVPRIVIFRDKDRYLDSQYELTEVADDPPAALSHLVDLAELDLPSLRDEAVTGPTSDVSTRRDAANRVLQDAFEKSWNQDEIALQIEIQGTLLHIHATTPHDRGLSEFADHSDGMRWFGALLAFTKGWSSDTILLVDEIERHLHYDAQADLVDVLTRQSFTSKVIYTTHSFGCLPHDLGTGVRVVHPLDSATSRLENGFWKAGSGFSPLLASMGAAAASFTPTRYAVIGEGPADAILAPTLLRQACKVDRLDFQVAPGLSSVAAAGIPALSSEAGHVAFMVDGDQGGRDLRALLVSSGVSTDRIVEVNPLESGEELEIEDLVDAAIYAQAVNDELRCWQPLVTEFAESDVSPTLRTKALETWCSNLGLNPPDKVPVAQRVIDMSAEQDVFNRDRRDVLHDLLARIRAALALA